MSNPLSKTKEYRLICHFSTFLLPWMHRHLSDETITKIRPAITYIKSCLYDAVDSRKERGDDNGE